MDLSITLTPEGWQARGARAYDAGLGQDDHGIPLNSDVRKHWQYGWHQQRIRRAHALARQVAQRAEATPS